MTLKMDIDSITSVFCLAVLGLVIFIFGKIIVDITVEGLQHISMSYLLENPTRSGRSGGVFPIIISTLIVIGIAAIVAVPISLSVALFVTEYIPRGSQLRQVFRISMLVLASVPSIAFGLFGSLFFAQTLGLGTSLLTGGLTLAVMIIPICAFAFEEVFRFLPFSYRNGAYVLGATKAQFIFRIMIPATWTEIVTVTLLGLGRALAETAALLFTAGYSYQMPRSVLDPGRVLSVHIYDLAMNIPGGNAKAYASALLLISMFLLISSLGLLFTKRP